MNAQIINFIQQHCKDDVQQLALQSKKYPDVDMPLALQQIAGWKAAQHKLPTWATNLKLIYPPHLSMEQCSSEQTARYKVKLVQQVCSHLKENKLLPFGSANIATSLVDLTGGFGVDFSFMASAFHKAVYVEQQQVLCDIAQHNFPLLGINNATVVCCDSAQYLQSMPVSTIIFIDPARRDAHGGKTVAISNCTPNLLTLLPLLLSKSLFTLVKLSPMLDWHQAIAQLNEQENCVRQIHIVSINNECKELLLVLSKKWQEPLSLHCVNNDEVFVSYPQNQSVSVSANEVISAQYIGQYLYEPNASIMKAGCFSALVQQYPIKKIAPNSHLFISSYNIDNFPGRKFQISSCSSMNKKMLKAQLSHINKANITVRNFPLTVAQLRQRLHIKEGGGIYIFATTDATKKHWLLIC